jgi:hypothetical protein
MPSIEWLTNTWHTQHMTRVTNYYMTRILLWYIYNEIIDWNLETLNPYSSHLKFNETWTHGNNERCTCIILWFIIITICIYTYIIYTLIQRPRWTIRIISQAEYETNHVVRMAYMSGDFIITSAYMTCPYCLTSHGCSHECHVSM